MMITPEIGLLASAMAIALYIVDVLYTFKVWHERQQPNRIRTLALAGSGCCFHWLSIIPVLFLSSGMNFSLFPILSLAMACTITLLLIINIWQPIIPFIFSGLLCLAISALLAAALFQSHYQPHTEWTLLHSSHVVLSITAWSVLIIAGCQSLLASYQASQLKRHPLNSFLSLLPPLQSTEKVFFELLGIGWLILTASIVSGLLAFDNLIEQNLSHKVFFSVLAWALISVVIGGHWFIGWRGKKTLRWSQWAIALMLMGYLGSKIVLELILKR